MSKVNQEADLSVPMTDASAEFLCDLLDVEIKHLEENDLLSDPVYGQRCKLRSALRRRVRKDNSTNGGN